MSKVLDKILKLEKQKRNTGKNTKRSTKRSAKRSAKRSTEKVQLLTAVYDGLTTEEKKQIQRYYDAIENSKRNIERIQLLAPEDGLTKEQKYRLEKYYKDKGVNVSLGRQLKVIRVYDQGYILPYECRVNDEEKAVILFGSVYKDGRLMIQQSAACSETRFNELMEKDTDTIQITAVKIFPNLFTTLPNQNLM